LIPTRVGRLLFGHPICQTAVRKRFITPEKIDYFHFLALAGIHSLQGCKELILGKVD
jgi:hypothetical protein